MSVEPEVPEPRWAVPPEGGWTADDLDRLPDLPPHTQLIDSSAYVFELEPATGAYVFELEPATGAYTSTGIFHDRMKVSAPFPVDLGLSAIAPRRRAADPH
ncbi:hypothetical protein SAMN05216483_2605 [Streptomyces sp. 2131.1]|uniref:hypothetical protein n=1 Tax=Streptomyces sp. 2131.1 TaxID=1855346 RepID=UPI00089853F7|nr:hypothetical protein [Streptomyces sp. 2131.1]SEC88507.1 hypothetical protein SAMN05216483_2605 [Streptomyces sp. 2131.1]